MTYEVIWLRPAMDDLFQAEDPATQSRLIGITRGLERALAHSPHTLGESRGEGGRLAFFELLAVRYRIDDAAPEVRITRVQRYGR